MIEKLRALRLPGKAVAWTFSILGLLMLAEPTLQLGIFGDPSPVVGMALMSVGTILLVGIPSLNEIWDQIEYGTPALIFIIGLSFLYIQANSWEAFISLLQKYTVFGFVTGIVVTSIEAFLSQE